MKAKPVVLYLVLAAVVIGALLAGLAVQAAWPERRWMNIQLHSAMEALGGLAAIVMAFVLLQRRQEPGGDTYSRLALGFLGMGARNVGSESTSLLERPTLRETLATLSQVLIG